jgi:hypothetical protein
MEMPEADVGVRMGDSVLVAGQAGHWTVTKIGNPHAYDPASWVRVERRETCKCRCGDVHERHEMRFALLQLVQFKRRSR